MCPVCFNGTEAPIVDSARVGVLAMASVTVGVLSVVGAWVRRLARLEHQFAETQSPVMDSSVNVTSSRLGTRTTSNG